MQFWAVCVILLTGLQIYFRDNLMEKASHGDVTRLLLDWRNGDKEALNELMPLVYEELLRIARQKFQQYGLGGALQPTALVHEAYLKLVDEKKVEWHNRAHFYAIAANTIRRILVEDYRKRMAKKRGGKEMTPISLAGVEASTPQAIDFIDLNEVLERLEALNERQARIIELRFFGGLTDEEIAQVLDLSLSTVKREWRSAKAWLYSQLEGS
jgi:RNA polymerase sigma-70 factor, ECF subfamily